MKRRVYFMLIFFMAFPGLAEAQIFEKLVKKVVREVVEETIAEEKQVKGPTEGSAEGVLTSDTTEGMEMTKPGSEVAAGADNSFRENTRKEVLGPLEEFILFSPDKKHVAHSGFEGSRQVMLVNGKPGPVLDDVNTRSFKFSNEGGSYVYVGIKEGECLLIQDGEVKDKLLCINELRGDKDLFFNRDGSVLAYYKQLDRSRSVIMINGKPGPEILHNSFRGLTVRGKNVFYTGRGVDAGRELNTYLYKNNEAELETPVDKNVFFVSEDGETHAYLSYQDNEGHVVVNGKKPPKPAVFSVDMDLESGAVFCTGRSSGDQLIWKEKIFSVPEGESLGKFSVMSSDGSRIAYLSAGDGGQRLWVDGKPGPFFKAILEVQFTGDGKNVVYIVDSGGKNFVVVNETSLGPFEKVTDLQVSKAGGAYTFVAKNGNSYHQYLNGEDLGVLGDVGEFTFSPDGSRYAVMLHGEKALYLDGEKLSFPDFEEIARFVGDHTGTLPRNFLFSPRGNRLAFTYKRASRAKGLEEVLVLDDEQLALRRQAGTFAYPTFSEDGIHFAFLAKVERETDQFYWQLYIDMKPGPVVSGMKNSYSSPPKNVSLEFLDNNSVQAIGVLNQEIVKHTVTF